MSNFSSCQQINIFSHMVDVRIDDSDIHIYIYIYIYIYINVVIKTIVRIEFSAYKIVRIECSMRTQSGITQDEKHKLLHRNLIYYRTVSYGKC